MLIWMKGSDLRSALSAMPFNMLDWMKLSVCFVRSMSEWLLAKARVAEKQRGK